MAEDWERDAAEDARKMWDRHEQKVRKVVYGEGKTPTRASEASDKSNTEEDHSTSGCAAFLKAVAFIMLILFFLAVLSARH